MAREVEIIKMTAHAHASLTHVCTSNDDLTLAFRVAASLNKPLARGSDELRSDGKLCSDLQV